MYARNLCCQTSSVFVRVAEEHDLSGFLGLAAQVEDWFGPMVEDVAFESLGFTAGEAADPGPEGGSRQIYRLLVPAAMLQYQAATQEPGG